MSSTVKINVHGCQYIVNCAILSSEDKYIAQAWSLLGYIPHAAWIEFHTAIAIALDNSVSSFETSPTTHYTLADP